MQKDRCEKCCSVSIFSLGLKRDHAGMRNVKKVISLIVFGETAAFLVKDCCEAKSCQFRDADLRSIESL